MAVTFTVAQVNRPLERLAATLPRSSHALAKIDMPRSAPAEFRAFAERFNHLSDRLSAQEAERRVLLAGVSHDLRAPLTRIRLRAEMLDDADASAALVRDAESMRRIVDQFLDYHREFPERVPSPVDLVPQVGEIVDRYAKLGHRISLDASTPAICNVDPLLVERMLAKLIDNALVHGAEPVEVVVHASPAGARLEVRDHGPGVRESDLPRIVRPFERLDGARNAQGHCGLGLAIVVRLAGQAAGRLELTNASGGGLQARIELPPVTCLPSR